MSLGRQRRFFLLLGLLSAAAAGLLVFLALDESMVYYHTPGELAERPELARPDRRMRIGGVVERGSLARSGETIHFVITDFRARMPVTYQGLLPDLFREGEGVIAEGRLDGQGGLTASAVLAKHDESYMPPDMTDELKRSGTWQHKPERP